METCQESCQFRFGAGGLLKAAGLLSAEDVEARTLFKGPEFRTILYEYFRKNGSIDPAVVGRNELVGRWKFVPESVRGSIEKDVELMLGQACE